MSIYKKLYVASGELQEIRSKFQWELNCGEFAGCNLYPIPQIDDIRDCNGWRLAENLKGTPVGIEHLITWGSSIYVDGDFTKVTKNFDGEVLSVDGTVHRQSNICRELTAEEQEFAKEKFVELLAKRQNDLLEQRARAREIMEGDYE